MSPGAAVRCGFAARSPTSTNASPPASSSTTGGPGCSSTTAHYFVDERGHRPASRRHRRSRRLHDRGWVRARFVPDACAADRSGAVPAPRQVPYAALLSGGVRLRLHRSGRRRTARVAVGVGEDAVRRHGRRRRHGARVVLGLCAEDLTRFIDARVRLRGNAGTLYNQARQVRGVTLFAAATVGSDGRDCRARPVVAAGARDLEPLHPSRDGPDRPPRPAARHRDRDARGPARLRRGHHDALAIARRASQRSTSATRPAPR